MQPNINHWLGDVLRTRRFPDLKNRTFRAYFTCKCLPQERSFELFFLKLFCCRSLVFLFPFVGSLMLRLFEYSPRLARRFAGMLILAVWTLLRPWCVERPEVEEIRNTARPGGLFVGYVYFKLDSPSKWYNQFNTKQETLQSNCLAWYDVYFQQAESATVYSINS